MLFVLSLGKLTIWAISYLFPGKRQLAENELKSNIDVLRVCLALN
jgi:hypothetical protein